LPGGIASSCPCTLFLNFCTHSRRPVRFLAAGKQRPIVTGAATPRAIARSRSSGVGVLVLRVSLAAVMPRD